MSRRKVTLHLNVDVILKAKNLSVNISGFLEVKLVEYIYLIIMVHRGGEFVARLPVK